MNHAKAVAWWRTHLLLEANHAHESNADAALRLRYQEHIMGKERLRMLAIFLLAQGIGRACHAVADAKRRDARQVFAEIAQRYGPPIQKLLMDTYNDVQTPYGPEMVAIVQPFERAITILRQLGQELSRLCLLSRDAGGESAAVVVDDVVTTYLAKS